MGRKKSAPVQRPQRHADLNGDGELLGQASRTTANRSVEEFMTAGVLEGQNNNVANNKESRRNNHNDDDDDDDDDTSDERKRKSRPFSVPPPGQRNGRHTAAVTLQDRLQQILDEQQDKQARRRASANNKHKKNHAKKQQSSSSISVNEKDSSSSLSLPEIEIIPTHQQSEQDFNNVNSSSTATQIIRVHHDVDGGVSANTTEPETDDRRQILIVHWTLVSSTMEVVSSKKEPTPSTVRLKTSEGARQILEYCVEKSGDCDHFSGSIDDRNNFVWDDVVQSIQQGTLYCQLNSSGISSEESLEEPTVKVAIGIIASTTLTAGDPDTVVIQPKGKKQQQLATTVLSRALAVLLPQSLMADVVRHPLSARQINSETSVTAKQIYALVDNQQYDSSTADEQEDCPRDRSIPGLIPTLRPYQYAAVQWMLERETSPQSGPEWELAWIVVYSNMEGKCQWDPLNTSPQHFKTGGGESTGDNFREYQHSTVLFHCPFTGWWVDSYAKAEQATIGRNHDHDGPTDSSTSTTTTRGGILAESMGLGKTVEVLACILAHPRRQFDDSVISSSDTGSSSSLAMSSEMAIEKDSGTATAEASETSTKEKPLSVAQAAWNIAKDRESYDSSLDSEFEFDGDNRSSSSKPGQAADAGRQTESWIQCEDLEFATQPIGVCICGQTIHITEKLPVVLCETCREPMHAVCADLPSFEPAASKPPGEKSILRFRYGIKNIDCPICREVNCPCCFSRKETKLQSRATLIVTPPAILSQWQREIQRHTAILAPDGTTTQSQPLKVVIYPGVKALCNQQGKGSLQDNALLMHPRRLGDADVVLMTFDALMGDLNHSDDNPFIASGGRGGRSLRQRKIYRVVPSPLLSVNWWRICLDEAQRVETPTAASAKMALKLQAENRWCVSGTPVGRGKLDDLHGLLLFQRLYPFGNKAWFNACFRSEHRGHKDRIRHLLHACFWRSTKTSERIRAQMGIPEQTEEKVVLEFSSVERHFYQRQHEETLNAAADLQTIEKAGRKRSLSLMNILSTQFRKLRAACCHPQVGSSGLARGLKRRKGSSINWDEEGNQGNSRILSMNQILDRLIDDARLKAEEAQRLCLLHNNAMAALSTLKCQAKDRGITFQQRNAQLLTESCKLYLESLKTIEENSKPTKVTGETVLSGSLGFQFPNKIVRDGRAALRWQMTSYEEGDAVFPGELWVRFDFEGPSKKITQIQLRHVETTPGDKMDTGSEDGGKQVKLYPKTCIFQISNASVGGAFVDVVKFELPAPTKGTDVEWTLHGNFQTNRSKSWRLFVQDYHRVDPEIPSQSWCCAVEIELSEAYIGGDSLQRLHALHNAALSFESLMKISKEETDDESVPIFSPTEMKEKATEMRTDARRIEKLHLEGIVPIQKESQRLLKLAVQDLKAAEQALFQLSEATDRKSDPKDYWNDEWWNDILLLTSQYGSSNEQFELCRRVHEDISSAMEGAFDRQQLAQRPFPAFNQVIGLYHSVNIRIQDLREVIAPGALVKCLCKFLEFPINPSQGSIIESSTCERCKKDWTWTGRMCSHCKLSIELNQLEPDRLLHIVLGSIHGWMKGTRSTGNLASARSESKVDQRAKFFFDALEATKKAKSAAEKAWRVHLDLLNDLDELNMCKGAVRLSIEGEDLSKLTEAELNGIVHPIDVANSFLNHQVKQATAFANLRRHSSTLRYLKNQNDERMADEESSQVKTDQDEESCILCLSNFEGQRAVLACGHSFHYSPCLERLIARSSSSHFISCPLRCTMQTKRDKVMIATESQAADVAHSDRKVKGSWGTKVTRLVADVLDVSDRGEKSIVFSQWEDMMDVVESAFRFNSISFVRVTSLSKISDCTKRFRLHDCSVLLLNVKNGAEGLTLVEATHIFMVEPLLNCGLDLQAINRIHRIGQRNRTFVHRYLIKDTIEINIDKFRMEHQDEELEEDLQRSKKSAFKAGGIDGGFNSQEELLGLLSVPEQE